jgi:hypothetical protein
MGCGRTIREERDSLSGMWIPNTLKIRPGYRFAVMVDKDIRLQPYVDHRAVSSIMPINLGPVLQ